MKRERKDVFLTEANGAHDVIFILGCENGLDLEALAAPQRHLRSPRTTRVLSLVLAILWVGFLITVAGWQERTWYLLSVGIMGIVHNVGVAGTKRQPKAFGIDLRYQGTIVEGKVMEVLRLVESAYPEAGAALREEFFNGKLYKREELLWEYADRRARAYKDARKAYIKALEQDFAAQPPRLWDMPPLSRPAGTMDDLDIPSAGGYELEARGAPKLQSVKESDVALGVNNSSRDYVIQID